MNSSAQYRPKNAVEEVRSEEKRSKKAERKKVECRISEDVFYF